MNEFELIHHLTGALPSNESVVIGPGDDCAVLEVGAPERLLLFKTDAVVEGIHSRMKLHRKRSGIKRWPVA